MIFRDKHTRYYCAFIIVLILFLFLIGIIVIETQTAATKEILLTHDNAIATSLLKEGISKEIVAKALTNTETDFTGSKFLAEIGLSNRTDMQLFPYVSIVKNPMRSSLLGMLFFWTVLMVSGTMVFLYRREQLYKKSESIIKDYIDGNYTVHLPQSNEGTIYQLLSSVDQLATMLQAKNDAEIKTKEFLKSTISDISHQLKTPLAALMMYQEIIENEPDNTETVKEFSLKMGTALKRIEQLIQSMLKITRIDACSISFEKSNYSISNILNHAISELTTRANNESKEIIIDGNLEQMLYCDIEWTSEAIGNIIKNALDHIDTGEKSLYRGSGLLLWLGYLLRITVTVLPRKIYTTYLKGFIGVKIIQIVKESDLDCHWQKRLSKGKEVSFLSRANLHREQPSHCPSLQNRKVKFI